MEAQTLEYEGTWEEIVAHESEFRGFRLRLTVLTDIPTATPKPAPSANELLKLPLEERNGILAEQAALLENEYRTNPDLTDFETFGPDDLYDEYPDNGDATPTR
ncbi:MAG TPA: hypothetical protein VKU00_26225 [Chthonomonadaceae bacterium]|nr:hypothetical protein [Chthonomonadaceae bacterium]